MNNATIQAQDLVEFKDAAISLCGSNAFLFLIADVPSPKNLEVIINRCERLLAIAKKIQGGAA